MFMSASKAHEKLMEVQKSTGGRKVRLKKFSDTRWSCRYDSIAAGLATFLPIKKAFGYLANDSDKNELLKPGVFCHL